MSGKQVSSPSCWTCRNTIPHEPSLTPVILRRQPKNLVAAGPVLIKNNGTLLPTAVGVRVTRIADLITLVSGGRTEMLLVSPFYSVRGEPVEPPLRVGHVSTGPELD